MKIFRKDRKSEEVNSPILQAYFTSLLSLVLCMSMFLGTSYAWFTSEVENTGNEIHVGMLEVELEKQGDDDKWTSLDSTKTDSTNLFDNTIRWYPGYTSLETIRISNKGDLDFKYTMNFIEGTSTQAEVEQQNQEDTAQYFEVWVYDHTKNTNNGKSYSVPGTYQDIATENNGWAYVGTLQDILAGETVLEGDKLGHTETATAAQQDTSTQQDPSHTYTIAIHMRGEADASVMGKQIPLNVKLVAYQLMDESGDVGEDQQSTEDTTIGVTNLSTLTTALAEGQKVLLTTDIAIDNVNSRLTMNGGVLDGNGNTIEYTGGRGDSTYSVGVLTSNGGTICNVTVTGSNDGRALYVTSLSSDLKVTNCTLSGSYSFNLNSADEPAYSLTFAETTFKSWTSYANAMTSATFTKCTFEDTLRPYGETILTNCVFSKETLDVSKLEVGETITLTGCTYGVTENVSLVVAHVTGEDGESQITVKGIDGETVNVSIDTNGCLTFGNAG